jgi:hypothetical protein
MTTTICTKCRWWGYTVMVVMKMEVEINSNGVDESSVDGGDTQ